MKVNLRVAASEESASGGAGWVINAGFAETPFGTVLIADGAYGICHLSFIHQGRAQALKALKAHWPSAELMRNDGRAEEWCGNIFSVGRTACVGVECPVSHQFFVKGTDFQIQIWQASLRIPAGATVSYGQLASMIGHPKASRAVGGAVGRNPVAYLIPCHRVICSDGTIGGYHWGVQRKKAILEWECKTSDPAE